jgi:hypothetical protein
MEVKNKGRWYIRVKDKVRGPFPNQLIGSYLILDRINLHTEVSQDKENWTAVKNYPALVPDVVLNAHTTEGAKALMLARVREDERRTQTSPSEFANERRIKDESKIIKLHRQLRDDILIRYRKAPVKNTRNIVVAVLVVLFVIAVIFDQSDGVPAGVDCNAPVRIGMNWSECNKQGQNFAGMDISSSQFKGTKLNAADFSRTRVDDSDLSYANLFQAQMQQSSLQNVLFIGANLRQANLRAANLQGADLSYAELVDAKLDGANLSNARFDHALWVNGKICLPGSIGACLQPK